MRLEFRVFFEMCSLRFGAACLSVGSDARVRGHTGLLEGFLLGFWLCKFSYQGTPIDPLKEPL